MRVRERNKTMNINDDAEKIEGLLLAFGNEVFGGVIPLDMADPEVKAVVEEYRDLILEVFS